MTASAFSLKFDRLLDSERPALRSVWMLIFFWLESIIIWYPSTFNCFNFSGTLGFHHFQSDESRANRFPEAVAINVESWSNQHRDHAAAGTIAHTRSNAATFRLFPGCVCAFSPDPEAYFPAMRLLLTILQVIFSGFFCEIGVKKEATAVSSIQPIKD